MHTEGRGLKEVTVEQEAEVLPSHARDDGGSEIQKDKRGKREKVGATWRALACGCSKEQHEGASQPLKSESIQIPQKQHLTATPVRACKPTFSYPPPTALELCCAELVLTPR